MPFASYSMAPWLAWAGWRLRIPGGPAGGAYHGFIAPDDLVNHAGGWPAGHAEIFRPMDNPQNLGIYPWHPWDTSWVGVPLKEGQTVSDFVYRSPAELRPRPNASGGINVVRGVQYERTPGYAVAPGNYRTLGALPAAFDTPIKATIEPDCFYTGGCGPHSAMVRYLGPPVASASPSPKACPAWGCGPPPWTQGPTTQPTLPASPAPGPTVAQPPPPVSPAPAPTVPIGPAGSSGCPAGEYRDAAGNCTSDWRNPYSMYLPLDAPISPSPTVAASTCPTGYTQDASGNCLAPGVVSATPASSGIMGWLEGSTAIGSYQVPNYLIAAGVGLVAFRMMGSGGGRRR